MLFLSCSLCCSPCSVFIYSERIYCSCACLRDVCQTDGVYQLNYRAFQRCTVFLHLTGNFIYFYFFILFFFSWHRVCSRIFHHLWKYLKWPAESDTLCLCWRTAVWWHVGKFNVNAADSLPKSKPEGGIGGEMRRQTPPHTSQPPWYYGIGKLGS